MQDLAIKVRQTEIGANLFILALVTIQANNRDSRLINSKQRELKVLQMVLVKANTTTDATSLEVV